MDKETDEGFGPFADFTLGLAFDSLSEDVVVKAEELLLDTLGIAAAATATDAGRIAAEMAATQFCAGPGAPGARLIFGGRVLSPAGAAYAGASTIDNLDGHDGYAPAKGHISVATVPALFALAEAAGRVNGREALTALVLGWEVASRAGLALHASVADYHTSGAWNALAVAAMGARLLGLDRDGLRQAIGIAEYHGPRSQMMREIDNPSMLHDGSGWGALAGVTAALLAARGFTGAPAVTIEAPETAAHWSSLGAEWLTLEQYIKPYPVCRWAHALVDGALSLRAEHGLTADMVAAIELRTFHESARLATDMPRDTARAQYSLPFPVAAALVRGRVGQDEVLGSGLGDPAIERLVDVTTVIEEETYNRRFPAGRWGDVTLVLEDGRRLGSGEVNARGGRDDPLSRDEIVAKFRDFAEPVIEQSRAKDIEAAVFSLHEPGADLGALIGLCAEGPAAEARARMAS